jgi:transcriptional activator SPT8
VSLHCEVELCDSRLLTTMNRASSDNIRLWNAAEAGEPDASGKTKSGVQFKIIPGHHGGYISQMSKSNLVLDAKYRSDTDLVEPGDKVVDPAARFLVSASSNRGWHGESSRTVFVHDIKTYR